MHKKLHQNLQVIGKNKNFQICTLKSKVIKILNFQNEVKPIVNHMFSL